MQGKKLYCIQLMLEIVNDNKTVRLFIRSVGNLLTIIHSHTVSSKKMTPPLFSPLDSMLSWEYVICRALVDICLFIILSRTWRCYFALHFGSHPVQNFVGFLILSMFYFIPLRISEIKDKFRVGNTKIDAFFSEMKVKIGYLYVKKIAKNQELISFIIQTIWSVLIYWYISCILNMLFY